MRRFAAVLLCLALLSLLLPAALAADDGPDDWTLDTEALPQEEEARFLAGLSLCFFDEPPAVRREFFCYAAAEDGSVAIGMENGEQKIVCILDAQGEHLLTLKFLSTGSYKLGWAQREHTLIVRLYRSDNVLCIRPDRSISVRRLLGGWNNNRQIYGSLFGNTQRVGDQNYRAENPLGFFNFLLLPDHFSLTVSDESGTRTLYEAEHDRLVSRVTRAVFTILVIIAGVWAVIDYTIRSVRAHRVGRCPANDPPVHANF